MAVEGEAGHRRQNRRSEGGAQGDVDRRNSMGSKKETVAGRVQGRLLEIGGKGGVTGKKQLVKRVRRAEACTKPRSRYPRQNRVRKVRNIKEGRVKQRRNQDEGQRRDVGG